MNFIFISFLLLVTFFDTCIYASRGEELYPLDGCSRTAVREIDTLRNSPPHSLERRSSKRPRDEDTPLTSATKSAKSDSTESIKKEPTQVYVMATDGSHALLTRKSSYRYWFPGSPKDTDLKEMKSGRGITAFITVTNVPMYDGTTKTLNFFWGGKCAGKHDLCTPGGAREGDESVEACGRREFAEETGELLWPDSLAVSADTEGSRLYTGLHILEDGKWSFHQMYAFMPYVSLAFLHSELNIRLNYSNFVRNQLRGQMTVENWNNLTHTQGLGFAVSKRGSVHVCIAPETEEQLTEVRGMPTVEWSIFAGAMGLDPMEPLVPEDELFSVTKCRLDSRMAGLTGACRAGLSRLEELVKSGLPPLRESHP